MIKKNRYSAKGKNKIPEDFNVNMKESKIEIKNISLRSILPLCQFRKLKKIKDKVINDIIPNCASTSE